MQTAIRLGVLGLGFSGLVACSRVLDQSSQLEPELTKAKGWDGAIEQFSVWPSEVQETSGLAYKAGLLWTINDSGDGAFVYALNERHEVVKKLRIQDAVNIDWEAMAQDEDYLYIADCGNNRGRRNLLQIYKVSWQSLVLANSGAEVASKKMEFNYADKPVKVAPRDHNFDCEALTVVKDELWLFSKNRKDEKTNLYRLDKELASQTVAITATYEVDGLVTAADYEPSTQRLALLGYAKQKIFGHSFLWIVPVTDRPQWQNARRTKLHPYAQWEALVWDGANKGQLRLSAERSILLDVGTGYLDFEPGQ